MKIKDLPKEERPREKALKYGLDTLSNEELLAIILRVGNKEENVKQLATNVLNDVGGLNNLLQTDYQRLMKIKGIKESKALTLASIILLFRRADIHLDETPSTDIDKILFKYQKLVEESNNGGSSSLLFSPRDIFKEIFMNNGYSFYLIHTHPNDIVFPSEMDIKTTRAISKKAKNANIRLIDSYIIGKDGIYSILNR